ncbi:MAG: hypothetical protein ABI843_01190 [Dokdonella sp.]
MKFFGKTLGLLLASLTLASCGGGGGNGGALSPPQSGSITLTATTTTLPLNTAGYDPGQRGAPTQAEVTIIWRNADGTLVNGHDIAVSISPITVAAISCLAAGTSGGGSGAGGACATTSDLYGSVPITGINGQATVFVNSRLTAGTANLVVSATDPATSRTVTANLLFTVTSGVGPAPANVTLAATPTGIYLPSSGGTSASSIAATVVDGGGQLIPDPAGGNNGVDNILFEIVGNAGDAVLATNSVAGPVQGTSVSSHTVHGVAAVSLQAGDSTPQGPIQIRATADRADNNVTNGIQDPISSTTSVIVSDGKLYSLEVTSPLFAPALNSITINSVSGNVSTSATAIPVDPDATLSLVVTALGTDRQGNPVLPGTPIRFGSVDEPVGAPGSAQDNQFLLSGFDGDPAEGGTAFSAPTGQFLTAGGGAGPRDALLVFGKAVQGNDDLESAVTVSTVNSQTSLTVSPAFNRNDTTGALVNSGPILPYLIGRSEHGNITATATTDAIGVAHGTLNYTINTIGDAVAIWAQGDGIDTVTNGPRRVTDAGTLVYPGVAPASISAFPNPILGDTTQDVTVCVVDALGVALRGVQVGFSFTLSGGTGAVDGTTGTGTFDQLTGTDGCSTGTVVTSGLPVSAAGGSSGTLNLSAAGQTTSIDIIVQIASLQASPNHVSITCSGSVTQNVTVRALAADGTPIAGAAISATCTASGGSGATLTPNPASATTDPNGRAIFAITAAGFVSDDGTSLGTGSCVFASTADASRSVTVNFAGSQSSFSPPLACGN